MVLPFGSCLNDIIKVVSTLENELFAREVAHVIRFYSNNPTADKNNNIKAPNKIK